MPHEFLFSACFVMPICFCRDAYGFLFLSQSFERLFARMKGEDCLV